MKSNDQFSYFCLFMLRYMKIKIYIFLKIHILAQGAAVYDAAHICSILHLPITKLINKNNWSEILRETIALLLPCKKMKASLQQCTSPSPDLLVYIIAD